MLETKAGVLLVLKKQPDLVERRARAKDSNAFY